jgi:acetoacetyl-CoA reductase
MKDKIALITGGTRGIGNAIATNFLENGAYVIAVATNKERNQKWIEEKNKNGFANVEAYACNVSDHDECQQMIKSIKEKHGKIDILVNNAGLTRDAAFRKMSKDYWDTVMRVNLDSLFNITQPSIALMLENGYGRIINISSVNAQKGQFGQTNYSAAKAGMHGFTKSLAQETARKNITVNTVSPGYINTDMMKDIPQEILTKIIATVPVGRLGNPEEIADIVAFLASEKSAYITGTDFSINGGLHMY